MPHYLDRIDKESNRFDKESNRFDKESLQNRIDHRTLVVLSNRHAAATNKIKTTPPNDVAAKA